MERQTRIPIKDPPVPERRDETIERVTGDPPDRSAMAADPTSRRRVGTMMSIVGTGAALAVAAIVIGVVLLITEGTGLALALGGAAALGAGIIAALVIAEREDGRIDRVDGDELAGAERSDGRDRNV